MQTFSMKCRTRLPSSISFRNTFIQLLLFLIVVVWGNRLAMGQEQNEDPAWDIYTIAVNAQNSEDFGFARTKWEELIRDFPNSILIGKAYYQLGLCYEKLGRHEDAVSAFGSAIPKLTGREADLQPLAYFHQAYCRYELGKSLLKNSDADSQKNSNIQLTTAAKNFEELLARFPSFENADQAIFFQGGAYELLKRTDDAISAYNKVLEYENPHFKYETLYFLGQIQQDLNKIPEALAYFDRFRKELGSETHLLLPEVEFSQAKALLSLAAQQTEQGKASEAVASYRSAEEIFKRLASSSQPKSPEIAQEALFQQAYCLANLNQPEQAAAIYEQVASQSDSPFMVSALVNAGRCYLTAGTVNKAIEVFKRATEHDSPTAAEAAALLVRAYLEQEDYSAAFDLADQFVQKQPASPMVPYLMMDRAEAAFKIPSRQAEAPGLFMKVVETFPDHSAAPSALYSAAFASFQLNDADAAIQTADRFVNAYPTSEFLPDAREIKADVFLLKDEAKAETEFDQLLADFPQHEKQNRWYLRSAIAKFFQQKYQATIDLLRPQLEQFDDPRQLAEAYHWVGASYFFLDQAQPAVEHLEKSIAASASWRSTDETMLTLARAYLKEGKFEQAQQTIERLKADFKDSQLVDRGHYFLGEYAYEHDQFQQAFNHFNTVYTSYPKSELAPNALYNAAWSKMKLNDAAESNALFSRLITEFPNHELANQARAGRGASARKTGNMSESITDLKTFIETKADGQEKFGAMFELALAYIEAKSWSEASATLESLLKQDPNSATLDSYHYELAWVLHEMDQAAKSLEHFAAITKITPVSRYAAEAYFHLASEAYRVEDFAQASSDYQKAIDLATETVLKEKALYKLGWTYFKQSQYEPAFKQFDRLVNEFPESSFFADGQFMRAESLFQDKKYSEAAQAYATAQPIVDKSPTIDKKLILLNRLHGAQAANLAKEFQAAIDLATPLTTATEASKVYQTDAWLEIGTALHGLNREDEAVQAWEKAKSGGDKTAVRARSLIGDHFFKLKQFDKAINEFKEMQYLYGNDDAAPEVTSWVAYAFYECARCYLLQASTAPEADKVELVKNAIRQFESLLSKYPDDRLAPEAKSQVEKLRQIRR